MALHETYSVAEDTALESVDYVTERGKPMPSLNHGTVQANLIVAIATRYKGKYKVVSELSLSLSTWPSVPDLSLYAHRPLDLRSDVVAMTEPPLCTVEIISPTQSLNELTDKARNYFAHGVQSCWIVLLPLGNIYVFSAPDDYQIFRAHETLHDTLLDISIPLSEVFETD
ncbi:MAG: Uma2 family endonuclease [Saprospiraceae bacterium]